MTIDEMIELAKTRNKICLNHSAEYRNGLFINAEESEQLVRRLEELEMLRTKYLIDGFNMKDKFELYNKAYNKGVDDFYIKVKDINTTKAYEKYYNGIYDLEELMIFGGKEITEQLKGE